MDFAENFPSLNISSSQLSSDINYAAEIHFKNFPSLNLSSSHLFRDRSIKNYVDLVWCKTSSKQQYAPKWVGGRATSRSFLAELSTGRCAPIAGGSFAAFARAKRRRRPACASGAEEAASKTRGRRFSVMNQANQRLPSPDVQARPPVF